MSSGTGISHCEHEILEVLVIQTGIGVQDAAIRRRGCGNVTAAAAPVFAEVSRWGIAARDAPMTYRGCGSVSAAAAALGVEVSRMRQVAYQPNQRDE